MITGNRSSSDVLPISQPDIRSAVPAGLTGTTGTERFSWTRDASSALATAAGRWGCSRPVLLTVALGVLASRYADSEDVDLEVLGHPVRLRLAPDSETGAIVASAREQLGDAADATQVRFHLLHAAESADADAGLTVHLIIDLDGPDGAVQAELAVSVDGSVPGLGQRLIEQLHHLVRQLGAEQAGRCDRLEVLTPAEYQSLVYDWNDTADPTVPVHRCLIELFREQVARTPHSVAVSTDADALTYQQLDERSDRIRDGLLDQGLLRNTVVAVLMPRGTSFIATLLGALKSAAAFMALDLRQSPEALANMLARSGAQAVVTVAEQQPLAEQLAAQSDGARLPILLADSPEPAGKLGALPERPCCGPGDLAYVMFTSGSTGQPKGTKVEHRGMINHIWAKLEDLEVTDADVIAQLGPPSFDIVVWQCLAGLLRGSRVHVIADDLTLDPAGLLEHLTEQGVTVLQIVPAMLKTLLLAHRRQPLALDRLRWLVPTGDALSVDLCRQWFRLHPDIPILNTYGSTECSDDQCHYLLRADPPAHPAIVPLGRPIANTSVYVLDSQLRPRPFGVAGELFIGGIGVGPGYLGDPVRTGQKFIADPFATDPSARLYRTGDLVRYREDGVLEFLGRIDSTVKVRGYRIELEEIESVLEEHPAVVSSVVAAWRSPQDITDARLCAYVVWDDSLDLPLNELPAFCSQRLAAQLVPAAFTRLDRLPLNTSGKIDRARLPEPEWSTGERGDHADPLLTDTEKVLADLWAQVLSVSEIGGLDSFFALGGNSLSALHLLLLLEDRFDLRLPLRSVFDNPRLREFAGAIDAGIGADEHAGSRRHSVRQLGLDPGLPFALTQLQQAYWVGQSGDFSLGGLNAHLYLEVRCDDLDLDRAELALCRLVAAHEVLRVIVEPDGQQRVLQQVGKIEIVRTDLRELSGEQAELAIVAARAARNDQGPATSSWPLFEVEAFLLPDGSQRLQLSISLHLLDAHSEHLLLRDWLRFYDDPDAETLPRAIDYRDYTVFATELAEPAEDSPEWQYWHSRLDDLFGPPDLPLASSPDTVSSPSFRRLNLTLDADAWSRIKQRAMARGLTASAVMFTAYAEVLARWSAEPRFTLNSLSSHRLPVHPDVARVAGNFGSTLPIEVDCSGAVDFSTRAARLQAQMLEDLDHGAVSGVSIVREAARRHGWSGRSVLPVVFASVLDIDTSFLDELPLAAQVVASGLQTPQVYLDHQIYEYRGCLVANWDVVDAVLGDELAEEMWSDYCRLVDRLAEDERCWVQPAREMLRRPDAALLSPAQAELARPGHDRELLQAGFLRSALANPDAPAIIDADRRLSYHDVLRRSAQVALRLRSAGLGEGDLVPVVMDKGWQQVVAVLGVLRAGAAYLPLDPALPSARLHYLIGQANPRIALTQEWLASTVDWPDGTAAVTVGDDVEDGSANADGDLEFAAPDISPDSLAYVIYTSGSTGVPKGVAIDHRSALNTIIEVNDYLSLGPADRVFAISSLSFDLSVWDIFGTLAAGAAIVLPSRDGLRDPRSWAAQLAGAGVTVWNSVPALLEMLLNYLDGAPSSALARVRAAMLSGDWIPVSLPDHARRHNRDLLLLSLGGATEASIWSIWYPIEAVDPRWRSIPYGRAMPGQSVLVLDDVLELRPAGVVGELYIGGIGVARGYWNDEAQTRQRFVLQPRTGERLYRTGDLGRLLPDGNIEFLGRADEQVKVQGYRVEPGEIEAAMLRIDGVAEAVVVAHEQGAQGKSLVAYYVRSAQADPTLDEAAIRAALSDELPRYLVPTQYFPMERIPLGRNGKVNRSVLPRPDQLAGTRSQQAPSTDAERGIVGLFQAILGRPVLDVGTDFFALGGTSFGAMRLVSAIEKDFGHRLSLAQLFNGASVAEVAGLLDSATTRPDQPRSVIPLAAGRADSRPLVLIHPVGGSVLCYAELLAALEHDGPVFGCQSIGLHAPQERDTSVDAMAQRYLTELLSQTDQRCFDLVGWSMGGVIAVSMAQRLIALGYSVGRLVLIDADCRQTPAGTDGQDQWTRRLAADLLGGSLPPTAETAEDARTGLDARTVDDADDIVAALRQAGALSATGGLDELTSLLAVFTANTEALEQHSVPDYPGPALLIRAAAGEPISAAQWQQKLPKLTVIDLPGNHYTIMAGAGVRQVADAIAGFDASPDRPHLTGKPRP